MKHLLLTLVLLLLSFAPGLNFETTEINSSWPSDKSNAAVNLNMFSEGVLKMFKEDMLKPIPKYHIPVMDPYRIPKDKTTMQRIGGNVHVNFTNTLLNGLSNFTVSYLDLSIKKLTCYISLNIPALKFRGLYDFGVSSLSKDHPERYMMNGRDLSIEFRATLSITDDKLQINDDGQLALNYAEKVEFKIDSHNETISSIFANSHKIMYEDLLRHNGQQISSYFLTFLNAKLAEFPARAFIIRGTTGNEYVDNLVKKLVKSETFKNLDPLNLPERSSEFSRKFFLKTISGRSRLFEGKLNGLSSLHRTGECDVQATKYAIFVEAALGIRNLSLSYNAEIKFMNFGPNVHFTGKIPYVDFRLKLRQSAEHGAPTILDDFEFVDMSNIKIQISGLGAFSFLAETMANIWLLISKKAIINMATLGVKVAILSELLFSHLPIW